MGVLRAQIAPGQWVDIGTCGPPGPPGEGVPSGGQPGQALVLDETGQPVWADCCGEGGCTDLVLTPSVASYGSVLLDELDHTADAEFGGSLPDTLWLSDLGMTSAADSVATVPPPSTRTSDYIGGTFQIDWPADSAAQGSSAGYMEGYDEVSQSICVTADQPGSIYGYITGADGEPMSGDIRVAIFDPSNTSQLDYDPIAQRIYLSYHRLGETAIDVGVPHEYCLTVYYKPPAPIRQHLDYDDPSFEFLIYDAESNLTVRNGGMEAFGGTGEFYDQGVAALDACYGMDLDKMIEESVRRIPTPRQVYGFTNSGNYSDSGDGVALSAFVERLKFNHPMGLTLSSDGETAIIDQTYTKVRKPYGTAPWSIQQGGHWEFPHESFRTILDYSYVGAIVTMFIQDAPFDQNVALEVDVRLMVQSGDPGNYVPVETQRTHVAAAGAWKLPTTVLLAGTGTDFNDAGTGMKGWTDWFVDVTFINPVPASLIGKFLLANLMLIGPDQNYPS